MPLRVCSAPWRVPGALWSSGAHSRHGVSTHYRREATSVTVHTSHFTRKCVWQESLANRNILFEKADMSAIPCSAARSYYGVHFLICVLTYCITNWMRKCLTLPTNEKFLFMNFQTTLWHSRFSSSRFGKGLSSQGKLQSRGSLCASQTLSCTHDS